MRRMLWSAVALATLSLVSLPIAGGNDPVLETILEVKGHYRAKRFEDADGALRRLNELLAAPERAGVRERALPVYHFYSAAVAWERKEQDRAREQILRFFSFSPDANLDPAAYPKSFQIFFEAQRNEAARLNPPGPAGPLRIEGGVLPSYATADIDASTIPVNTGDPEWVESPVRHLLLDAEKREWSRLSDDEARRDFVRRFWTRLDPDPTTPDNEFQVEFYRRVQYADANFSTERTRGALSDRGMVMLILGPPSYASRTPLLRSQDLMNHLRSTQVVSVSDGKGGHSLVRVESDKSLGSAGDIEGDIETWYFRRDRIPKGIPFTELQYQFVSRVGYGTCVLQREPRELAAIQKGARLLRR